MKKRIFGMVLALVLVLGLVPVTAWATEAEEYEYYYFKDKNFPTTGNAYFTKDAPELPGVTWDQENEVLTLENATLDKQVSLPTDATIKLIGDNTITVTSTADYHHGIDAFDCHTHSGDGDDNTLKIKGPGTLTINVSDAPSVYCFGIWTYHLKLSEGCTVNVTAGAALNTEYDNYGHKDMSYSYGIRSNAMTIEAGSRLNVTSSAAVRSWAVYCAGLTLGGTLEARPGDAEDRLAVWCWGNLTVQDTGTATLYGSVDATDDRNGYKFTAEGASVTGAEETFVSGQTQMLTQANRNVPIVIDHSGGSSGATKYTVTVVPGAHIKVDSDSVDKLTQTVSAGGYFDNVYFYTESGYYFPEDYAATLNGLKITRMNSTQAFVTGIPTGNTEFVLPAAVEGLRGTATVSGKGVVGQTLTVKLTDSNAEGALSYQWMYDNGATAKYIQGATGSSYTLTKADLDQRVFVEIKDATHPGAVYSADIGPITAADDSKDDSKDDNKPTPVWPDHNTRPSHGKGYTGMTDTTKTVTSAKTADAGVALYAVMALSALGGSVTLLHGRKRED